MHAQIETPTTEAAEALIDAARAIRNTIPKLTEHQAQALADAIFKAEAPEIRTGWSDIAKKVSGLHRSLNDGKAAEDQGVVGNAYRAARAAAARKTDPFMQIDAHAAIEAMAKSFAEDGTYASYAVNPAGLRDIVSEVGDLQEAARDLTSKACPGMGGTAINRVFFPDFYNDQAPTDPDGGGKHPVAAAAKTLTIRDLATELEERQAVECRRPTDLSDDDMDAFCNYAGAVAHKLIRTPAVTLDDFRAKAKAIAWSVNGDLDDLPMGSTAEFFSTTLISELLGVAPEPADETKLAEWDADGRAVVERYWLNGWPTALTIAEAFDPANGTLIGREAINAAWEESRRLHAAE